MRGAEVTCRTNIQIEDPLLCRTLYLKKTREIHNVGASIIETGVLGPTVV